MTFYISIYVGLVLRNANIDTLPKHMIRDYYNYVNRVDLSFLDNAGQKFILVLGAGQHYYNSGPE